MTVKDYINTYCPPGTEKNGTCIPISQITSFPLQVMISTMVRIVGSSSLHLATRTQMWIAVECMQGIVFDCCLSMISIMRKHLSGWQRGCMKNFRYSGILVVFFFERVPSISPVVALPPPFPLQPRLTRWGEVFIYQGGRGSVQIFYDDAFYLWWE